jgi:predicted membrane metal-binding protein
MPFAYYILLGTPSLIMGISCQHFYRYSYATLLIAFLCFLSIIGLLWCTHTIRSTVAGVLLYSTSIIISGALIYAKQWHAFEQFHDLVPKTPSSITGIIDAIECTEHMRTPHRITLNIKSIEGIGIVHASVFLYTQDKGLLCIGDSITLPAASIKKPGDTDFTYYLVKEGIYATLFLDTLSHCTYTRPAWSLQRTISEWRNMLFVTIRGKITPTAFALYSALFLGNRTFDKKSTAPLNAQFKRWGIAHIYARSGMHLGLIVVAWLALIRYIPLPYRSKHLFITFLSIIYALLSWSSISFMRSLAVFLCYQWCRLVKEPYNMLYLTTLICGGTLICNPLQLLFLDFQLSYALTAALAFLYHISAAQKNY